MLVYRLEAPDLNCFRCHQLMAENAGWRPTCHGNKQCEVSHLMQPGLAAIIDFWSLMRFSEFLKGSGAGSRVLNMAEVSDLDLELLLEVDREFDRLKAEKNKH